MYRLTASDVAEFLTPARVQEIVQLAAAGKLSGGTGALETAARLPRLLRAVRRIQVLKRLRKSGLITCTKWSENKSKLFTLISCPNDKLEYTAEQYKMQKHVLSRNRTARVSIRFCMQTCLLFFSQCQLTKSLLSGAASRFLLGGR